MDVVAVADLCDRFGEEARVVDASVSFRNFGAREQFHGPISTVKCFEDNSMVKAALAQPGENRILVIDGGGSSRRSLLGGELAKLALLNGWSGLIIFGFIRDSGEIRNINIGVKALGTVPRKTEKRNLGYRDIIVEFAATRFIPGEYAYCDLDGIIVCKEKLHSS